MPLPSFVFFIPVMISAREITTYDPERDVEPHNPSRFPLDKRGHWDMVVEGGIGDRWSFTTNVVYRTGEAL